MDSDPHAAPLLLLGFYDEVAARIAERLRAHLAPDELAAVARQFINEATAAGAHTPVGMAAHRLVSQRPAALRRLRNPHDPRARFREHLERSS